MQSVECDVEFRSDDGTDKLEPVLKTYGKLFRDGGKVLDRPFFVRDLQEQGVEEAGFVNTRTIDYKVCAAGLDIDTLIYAVIPDSRWRVA